MVLTYLVKQDIIVMPYNLPMEKLILFLITALLSLTPIDKETVFL